MTLAAIRTTSTATPLSSRQLDGLTARAERRLLIALAERLPAWVTPDRLTLVGGLGLAGAGLCYRLVPLMPLALLGVNLGLLINWFGDSLDGTLARVRRRERPRYGFYVDHLVDGFGALFLIGGLAGSGLAAPALAWGLLVAYLLLQLHIALKAHATGVFQIAFGGIGGTELRVLLVLLNALVLARGPGLASGASLFDAALAAGIVAAVATLLRDAVSTARALDRAEAGNGLASG